MCHDLFTYLGGASWLFQCLSSYKSSFCKHWCVCVCWDGGWATEGPLFCHLSSLKRFFLSPVMSELANFISLESNLWPFPGLALVGAMKIQLVFVHAGPVLWPCAVVSGTYPLPLVPRPLASGRQSSLIFICFLPSYPWSWILEFSGL